MKKALIFNTEHEAKQFDWNSNDLTGSVSRFRFSRIKLTETVTLTKAQYAAAHEILATITDEEGNVTANPTYTALDSSYTLNKTALLVGDEFVEYDNEGEAISDHPDVVDVEGLELVGGE